MFNPFSQRKKDTLRALGAAQEQAKKDMQEKLVRIAKAGPPHGSKCTCAICVSLFGHPGSGPVPMVTTPGPAVKKGRLSPYGRNPEYSREWAEDIEVARYGLRTFVTGNGALMSLFMPTSWNNGVMEAKCLKAANRTMLIWGDGITLPEPQHQAPHDGCDCGIYACVDLNSLVSQYRTRAEDNVAVVAAEGPTIIGTKGFRTSAARVVAYWTNPEAPHCLEAYQKVCGPDVPHYTDITKMLKDFHFPEYNLPWPPEFPKWMDEGARWGVYASGGAGAGGGGYYTTYYTSTTSTAVVGAGGGGGGRAMPMSISPSGNEVAIQTPQGYLKVQRPMTMASWQQLKAALGQYATPGAVDALKQLWGIKE